MPDPIQSSAEGERRLILRRFRNYAWPSGTIGLRLGRHWYSVDFYVTEQHALVFQRHAFWIGRFRVIERRSDA